MAITNYGKLHGRDLALETISGLVPEGAMRNLLISLIGAIEEFRSEQPSLLQGTLDLDFFAKVLNHRAHRLILAFHGRIEGWGFPFEAEPIQENFQDALGHGLRLKQAYNFARRTSDSQVKDVLLVLITAAWSRQTDGWKDSNGVLLPTYLPAFPFDFLFMAMAVEQSLRPGRPVRSLMMNYDLETLETGKLGQPDPSQTKS